MIIHPQRQWLMNHEVLIGVPNHRVAIVEEASAANRQEESNVNEAFIGIKEIQSHFIVSPYLTY